MITELEIEGFKSFGSPAQKISLSALNFVVGANASGKTNLISALRFLRNAARLNVEFALNEEGGVPEVRNKILRERIQPKPLVISLKLDAANTPFFSFRSPHTPRILGLQYRVEIDLRGDIKAPEIQYEELSGELEDQAGKRLDYLLKRTKQEVIINDPTGPGELQVQRLEVPPEEATRLALNVGFYSLPAVVLRRVIENWTFYNINPHVARAPFRETPDVDLGPSGEYLAVILHKLEKQNGKGALDSIILGLKGAVPGFKSVKTTQLPVEGTWAFQILEEKIRGAINPASVSDGTIRLLALMVISTWTVQHASLISIEEPENGLHPHLSEHIVDILRTASKTRQILVTTHNPSFLDYLEPDEVILCDKQDGFTQVRRASDVDHIKTFQKHFRLGELWVQGTLGGIP